MSVPSAALTRRLASALYEALVVLAVAFVATFPFLALFGDATHGWRRTLLQAWMVFIIGAYFVWFWTHGGQTLPMKTWHLRLVRNDGAAIGIAAAIHRYLLALLGTSAVGIGFLWALVDRERLFLHDRLAGTVLVNARQRIEGG